MGARRGTPESSYGFYSREHQDKSKRPVLVLSSSGSVEQPEGKLNSPGIAGEWEITCTGDTIYIFNLKLDQSGDKFHGKMVCTNRRNPLTKVEGRISPDGKIEFIRSRGSWRQYYHGKIVQESGTQATSLKGLYGGDKGQENVEWHAKLLSASN